MTDLAEALEWEHEMRADILNASTAGPEGALLFDRLIAAARRVVSGTPIRLCATHEGEVFHVIPGLMRGCYAGNEFKPCSGDFVDRILIDPEGIE